MSVLGYVALSLVVFLTYTFVIVPQQSPALFPNSKLLDWVSKGRYLNSDGYAIWYRDSLGDLQQKSNDDIPTTLQEVANRPIIVLLHGFPSFSYDFEEMYKDLGQENKYHIVTLDYLGFGMSDKPSSIDYSLVLQADIIEQLLGHVCAERRRLGGSPQEVVPIHLIAHDIGASIAQELLARQELGARTLDVRTAYRLGSVVLFNGGLFPETHVPIITQKMLISPALGPILQCLSNSHIFGLSLSKVFGANKPSEELLAIYWHMLRYKGGNLIMHRLAQYMVERRLQRERWVGALVAQAGRSLPIKLINGPADSISGMHMVDRYRELVPHANVDVLGADVGHYPQVEDHAHVMSLVRAFLLEHADSLQ